MKPLFFFTLFIAFCFIAPPYSWAVSTKTSKDFQIGDEILSHLIEGDYTDWFARKALKGKTIVMLFAAAEQDFSKNALHDVQNISDKLKVRDLKVFGIVSSSQEEQAIQMLIEKHHLTYPLLYDEGDAIAKELGILVYPTTLVINNEGKLAYRYSLYTSDYYDLVSSQLNKIMEDKQEDYLDKELVKRQLEDEIKDARVEIKKGKVKDAVTSLTKLLNQGHDSYDLHLLLGYSLINLNQPERALEHFKKAKEIQPNSTQAHLGLGIAYSRTGETNNALSLLTKTVKNDPDSLLAYRELSHIYEEREDVDKALYYIKKELDCLNQHIKD